MLLDVILSTVPFLLACMVRNTEERKAALRFSVSGGEAHASLSKWSFEHEAGQGVVEGEVEFLRDSISDFVIQKAGGRVREVRWQCAARRRWGAGIRSCEQAEGQLVQACV